jgi:hypothetical protein
MPIAASHVIDGRWQRQILRIGALDRAEKGAKIGKIS